MTVPSGAVVSVQARAQVLKRIDGQYLITSPYHVWVSSAAYNAGKQPVLKDRYVQVVLESLDDVVVLEAVYTELKQTFLLAEDI